MNPDLLDLSVSLHLVCAQFACALCAEGAGCTIQPGTAAGAAAAGHTEQLELRQQVSNLHDSSSGFVL